MCVKRNRNGNIFSVIKTNFTVLSSSIILHLSFLSSARWLAGSEELFAQRKINYYLLTLFCCAFFRVLFLLAGAGVAGDKFSINFLHFHYLFTMRKHIFQNFFFSFEHSHTVVSNVTLCWLIFHIYVRANTVWKKRKCVNASPLTHASRNWIYWPNLTTVQRKTHCH